jgi:CRISPR-associated protein Cmr4
MFAASECLFCYAESSLRVGSGAPRSDVDLPVQREAATGYPVVPSSSLKGVLRASARSQQAAPELLGLLGSEPEGDELVPSSIIVSDAVPLLFPVRSLCGLFAWATSVEALARFRRDLAAYGVTLAGLPQLPALAAETAAVAPETPLLGSKKTLVLEELSFPAQVLAEVGVLGSWLAEHAFPEGPVFEYWRRRVERAVVVLPEGAYRYLLAHGTQVRPRIRMDPSTGTAMEGSLWSEEFLPPETLVYALVGANLPDAPPGWIKQATDLIAWVRGLAPGLLQIGSGRTLGHGIVRIRWTGKTPGDASAPQPGPG